MSAFDRVAFAASLRRLADAMERGETIPRPDHATISLIHWAKGTQTPEGLAEAVRELGGTGWQQETHESHGFTWLTVTGDLGGGLEVRLQADAGKVTESVQTGVAPVCERKNLAMDAVIAEAQEGGEPRA